MSTNQIQCDICGVKPTLPIERMQDWVQPCPCGWTHRRCVNLGIMQLEATFPGRIVVCALCHTRFRIEPPVPYLTSVLFNMKRRWRLVNNVVAVTFIVFVIEAVFVTSGMTSLIFIWGREEVKTLISKDPWFVSDISLLISESAFLICAIPWEDAVLRTLRRGSHLPVIGQLLPIEDPDVDFNPLRKYPLVEGLLLPFFAKLTGDSLFFNQDNKIKRYLIGGLTFLLIKGIIAMFYKHKIYSRLCSLEIENRERDN